LIRYGFPRPRRRRHGTAAAPWSLSRIRLNGSLVRLGQWGSCSQAGVPETDYCTECKQSRESFTKKEFIAARESSMMEPKAIEDPSHLIPFAAECGVRDERDCRNASAWIAFSSPNGRATGLVYMSDR